MFVRTEPNAPYFWPKEIIDFYYVWKKTSHYEKWKKQYVPPYMESSSDDDEMDAKK